MKAQEIKQAKQRLGFIESELKVMGKRLHIQYQKQAAYNAKTMQTACDLLAERAEIMEKFKKAGLL